MEPRLLSVSVGRIAPLFVREQRDSVSTVMSAIRKSPVSSLQSPVSVTVRALGVDGDETADPSVHSGFDKAIYVMPFEHYAFWQEQRSNMKVSAEPMPHGFLGENLTIEGLLEENIWIGDELKIGDVVLRVTQPREPCFKFNARMGYPHAAKHMVQRGNSGWYASVVQTGSLLAGQSIHVTPGPRRISIAQRFAQLNFRARQSLF